MMLGDPYNPAYRQILNTELMERIPPAPSSNPPKEDNWQIGWLDATTKLRVEVMTL